MSDPVVEALNDITSLKFLPRNATHLYQPIDSFIMQKLKAYWRKQWEAKKIELILDNLRRVGPRASGKLLNPGKRCYILLAIDSTACINSLVDNHGMTLVRKAMVRCGLSLNSTSRWEETQPFQDLQDIIDKHRLEFEGQNPKYE